MLTSTTNSYHRGNHDQLHVLYGILDFTPLLDSATIRPTDWIQIAECIHDNYHNFEGFVILHGTDTMAYTSSALSFMLEGLGKAVVLTGSEYPLTMPYTDGVQNLVGSLMIAGWYGSTITEVTLFCCGKLFRGNRARKVNSSAFHSFTSPNFPPLATCAVDIKGNYFRVLLCTLWLPLSAFPVYIVLLGSYTVIAGNDLSL